MFPIFKLYTGYRELRIVPGGRGIAFVEFDSVRNAGVCLSAIKGMDLPSGDRLYASYAKLTVCCNKSREGIICLSHRFSCDIYFLGLTAHPATMRAFPPVGVQSRALQLQHYSHTVTNLLITHYNRLSMTEDSSATNIKANK